jgi:BirA family biotin operon repressor/biotin-[acetyl-CoA-carboxylase] ligase
MAAADNQIIVLDTIDSTNAYCLRHAAELAAGTAVVADRQTQGRGRRGRVWVSPPGNLFLSILLRPPFGRLDLSLTPLVAGLAVWETVRRFGVDNAWLKWPNDIWVGSRKLAGILCETGVADGQEVLVVGIGINVNMSRAALKDVDRPATSLYVETGSKIDRQGLVQYLLDDWSSRFHTAQAEGFEALLPAWQQADGLLGHPVCIEAGARTVCGRVTALRSDGCLSITRGDGELEVVASGEVSLRLADR